MAEYESPSENPEYRRRLKKLEDKEKRILEKSRELIMNNAAGHLAEIAPLDFINMLPQSERYFYSRIEPWWAKYV